MAKKQLDSRLTNVKLGLSEVTPYSGVFKRKVKDIKDWGVLGLLILYIKEEDF